jgi:voltage-gated potassium channel Kch
MLLAPLSFVVHERLLKRWLERRKPPEFDMIDGPGNPVIIAGYGRYGQIVSRVLRMTGIPFTAIEISYQQVDFVRRFGNKVYYGDASRLELLERPGAREAKLFVLAIDDVEASVKTAAVVRKNYPNLPILARPAIAFTTIGCATSTSRRSSGDLPVEPRTARQALEQLGMDHARAERAVSLFRKHDTRQMEGAVRGAPRTKRN